MKNTLKCIFYNKNGTKLLVILYFVIAVLMMLIGTPDLKGGYTSGMYLKSPSVTFMFPIFIVGAAVGIICCSDMRDKVSNYEILSGHSREQFYFTRFICSVIIASLLGFSLSFVPMIFGNLVFGWGDKLVFSEVLTRQLLFIFPFIRLSAFFVCLSFLVKNDLAMIGAGFGAGLATPVLLSFFGKAADSVFISIYNLNYLTDFVNWEIYNVSNEGITEYKTGVSTIEPGMVIGTIVISLLMTAVYMILGYGLFKRSDIE